MKKFFILGSMILGSNTGFAQPGPQLDAIKMFAQRNLPRFYDSSVHFINLKPEGNLSYLFPLYQLFKEEEKFKGILGSNGYDQEFSKAASFLEDYGTALEYQVKNYDPLDAISQKQIEKSVEDLKGVQHADASRYIAFAAKSYQVIMINEAYNKPLHRAFVIGLLDELYKKGFHYLAMETLNNFSKNALNRLSAATGYLTCEPVGGELVRIAKEKGFNLVPYEDTSSTHSPAEKETVRAANIFRIIQRDHFAKIFVLGSYGHIAKKSSDKNYEPMGMVFKKISGIDPLCIDQVSMCDESEFAYGKAFYDTYTDRFPVYRPSVAMIGSDAVNVTNDNGYDICVIHPHTKYRDNRPAWLSLDGLRQAVSIKPTVKNTFLVQAYYEEETKLDGPWQAIPADQTYIPTNKNTYMLFLRKGKYLIVFRDIAYRLIGKLNIEVN